VPGIDIELPVWITAFRRAGFECDMKECVIEVNCFNERTLHGLRGSRDGRIIKELSAFAVDFLGEECLRALAGENKHNKPVRVAAVCCPPPPNFAINALRVKLFEQLVVSTQCLPLTIAELCAKYHNSPPNLEDQFFEAFHGTSKPDFTEARRGTFFAIDRNVSERYLFPLYRSNAMAYLKMYKVEKNQKILDLSSLFEPWCSTFHLSNGAQFAADLNKLGVLDRLGKDYLFGAICYQSDVELISLAPMKDVETLVYTRGKTGSSVVPKGQ
jgi:hypothetical protein